MPFARYIAIMKKTKLEKTCKTYAAIITAKKIFKEHFKDTKINLIFMEIKNS